MCQPARRKMTLILDSRGVQNHRGVCMFKLNLVQVWVDLVQCLVRQASHCQGAVWVHLLHNANIRNPFNVALGLLPHHIYAAPELTVGKNSAGIGRRTSFVQQCKHAQPATRRHKQRGDCLQRDVACSVQTLGDGVGCIADLAERLAACHGKSVHNRPGPVSSRGCAGHAVYVL